MDSPEDSKIIADRLAKERHQMPQVPMAYKNGRQWHSRTRPEPAYLAHRPRRLPNQHGAVGDGLPLPQKSVSAARSARQEPEKDWTPYKLKASPHLADFFSSDDGHVATTLAELVASSDPEEEPMSEISAPVQLKSVKKRNFCTSEIGNPHFLTSMVPSPRLNYVAVSCTTASLPPNNPMRWRDRIEERNTNQGL